jgi:Bacteriophage protein of unknown function (DUF646).
MESNAARASYNFARRGTANVRRRAPVDTGYLKAHVNWRRISKGIFEVYVDGDTQLESGAYYAVYVEYGHTIRTPDGRVVGFQPAQPFFRPGIREAQQQFTKEMKAVFT